MTVTREVGDIATRTRWERPADWEGTWVQVFKAMDVDPSRIGEVECVDEFYAPRPTVSPRGVVLTAKTVYDLGDVVAVDVWRDASMHQLTLRIDTRREDEDDD